MDYIKFGEKEYLVKYTHLRAMKKTKITEKGGITIARVAIDLPEEEYVDARALCSPHDNFSKKRGRVIALGRLKKKLALIESKE